MISADETEEKSLLNKKQNKENTVFLDPVFAKEKFKINLEATNLDFLSKNQNEDLNDIKNRIKELSSETLFHWSDVPIVFPASLIAPGDYQLNNASLFILPQFNELEEIATDSNGKIKRLNKQQLESIKREGKFDVPSVHFPGKNHKWVLARWMQKGWMLSNETFYSNIAKALHLIIITAKKRFFSKRFSILSGLRSWRIGLTDLLDRLVGLPHKKVDPYESLWLNELQKYLVEDLRVDSSEQTNYEILCQKLKQIDPKSSKVKLLHKQKLDAPYMYRTEENQLIDLRLFNNDLTKKIEPILTKMLTMTESEKELITGIREETIKLYKDLNLSNQEITEKTNEILFNEFFKSLSDKLLNDSELEAIAPGIANTLIQNAKSIIYIRKICNDVTNEMQKHLDDYEAKLKKRYKVRSLVKEWLFENINEEKNRYIQKNLYEVHLRSIKKCYEEGLRQSAYFIERELIFLDQKSKPLIENYLKNKSPVKEFSFNRWIWLPKNYVVKKYSENRYTFETYVTYKNNSGYPFWRWKNFFLRTWVYFCNSFYLFGIVIPFASAFSYRALFSLKPFYPAKKVDDKTGVLITDFNSKTLTYWSRLNSIWSHVRVSRQKFEGIPDKGLIGKSVQRFFNKIWNYLIKGIGGTLGLTFIYPLLCLSISTGSLLVGLLTPIWYPVFSIIHHLGFLLIYDWDYCGSKKLCRFFPLFTSVFLRLFFLGLLQPVCALATAVVVCPILSFIVALFAVTKKCSRKLWDSFMFHCILKWQARIPSHDTFVARRIEGPGLASNYFYQAKPEQTLAALEANLESKLIKAYLKFIEDKLREPLEIYQKLFMPIFNPFSFNLGHYGPFYELSEEIRDYRTKYQDEASKRIQSIEKSYNNVNLQKVRLSEKDLNVLIYQSTKIVKDVYENSILKYMNKTAEQLFEEHGFIDNQWTTFTGTILEEIFGTGILTPLEDSDEFFNLEVNHLNLLKYSEMISHSEMRDDLDLVNTNYNPICGHISINMPNIDKELFSPQFQVYLGLQKAELSMPPRLPSAVIIAVHVFNKDKKNQDRIELGQDIESVINSHFKFDLID